MNGKVQLEEFNHFMEITINLIIGTSALLAILCWVLASHYFRHRRRSSAVLWLVAGIIFAALMGFFIWSAIPLWMRL